MKNILFLNDYGEHAKYIYQYAFRIGQNFSAKINAAHIFDTHQPIWVMDDVDAIQEYYDDLNERLDLQLEDETSKLKEFIIGQTPKQSQVLIGDIFIREGNTALEILDILEKEPIDLLVMGMNQQNKLANALFGNLSLQMIDKAPCPVLLVPRKSLYSGINEMIFAADFHAYEVKSIQYMLEWAKAFDAHLNVIHVAKSFTDHIHSEKDIEKWKQQFHKEIADWRLTFHLLNGDEEGIKNFVEEINADLICLSTHIRGFWTHLLEPNISKDIARKVDIPVLVVKPT